MLRTIKRFGIGWLCKLSIVCIAISWSGNCPTTGSTNPVLKANSTNSVASFRIIRGRIIKKGPDKVFVEADPCAKTGKKQLIVIHQPFEIELVRKISCNGMDYTLVIVSTPAVPRSPIALKRGHERVKEVFEDKRPVSQEGRKE